MSDKTLEAAHKAPGTFQGKRLSPLKAIRAFCVWCCGGSAPEVAACPSRNCALHPYRRGGIPPGAPRSLMRIIKARCLECSEAPAPCDAFQPFEDQPPCALWPFRRGHNPNIGPERRERLRMRGKLSGFQTGSRAVLPLENRSWTENRANTHGRSFENV